MTKKANYAATHPAEFEQGRRARLAAIDEQDAPHDAGTDALKAWKAGYNSADGEAARDGEPLTETKAEGQTKTVTH